MFSNNSKTYYRNSSSNSYSPYNQTSFISTLDKKFLTLANNIYKYYNKNDKINLKIEISNLRLLIAMNPLYKNSLISDTINNLINSFNSSLNINTDLLSQLSFIENNDCCIINKNKIYLSNTTINQDTSLKLVYLQYLLMYDIAATNGIFIDIYLENAQNILNSNNGQLVTNLNNYKY